MRALRRRLVETLSPAFAAGVRRGLPPQWLGWRWMRHETVPDHCRRRGCIRFETIHPPRVESNPLPKNVRLRDDLPADRGWWGYSFRDVPERESGETFLATLKDCRIAWYREPARAEDFYPAVVAADGTALDMREIRFRLRHADVLRDGPPPHRTEKAVWFAERCYHNHSHWLTAHLPKLLLLRDLGLLDRVLMPPERTAVMDASLKLLGLEPEAFPTWDPARPLRVEELTLVGTDRFRPDLLRLVPQALGIHDAPPPRRKVFISRAGAARRKLAEEEAIWPMLERAGFERVRMEDLSFAAQVDLMRETKVLVAPHGAGLTNMMFCPPGATVVEMADPGFPNPNFYALASALGHDYWILPARLLGGGHPLDRDLSVDPAAVAAALPGFAGEAAEA